MSKLQSIRGMHDCLPQDAAHHRRVVQTWIDSAEAFGYEEISFPILESTDLFQRSIGATTDIVEKEMYTFTDRNDDSLTLRPEGTASCARAVIQHGLVPNQQQRLWYQGPFFRHERPQKGRLRQFHQFGVETFGMGSQDIEVELLMLAHHGWQQLGLSPRLDLNTLGQADERAAWRNSLVKYFGRFAGDMEENDRRRLELNPLRLLDSKSELIQPMLEDAPGLMEHLGGESRDHFDFVQEALTAAGIPFTLRPGLVRGLDYYNQTVFEWSEPSLGAQAALGGGGRYDRLIEQLGGRATPAAGFALGLERIGECLERQLVPAIEVYLIALGDQATRTLSQLGQQLRGQLPQRRIQMNIGGGSMKTQMRRADKSKAQVALIMGEDEVASGTIVIKPLREGEVQRSVLVDNVATEIKTYLDNKA